MTGIRDIARCGLTTLTAVLLTLAPIDASAAEPSEGPSEAPSEAEAPAPSVEPLSPQERVKIRTMRRAGLGLLAAGGVVATAGLGLTIAFTVTGDQLQRAETPVLADVERQDDIARIGGILLASGLAVIAVGGVVFNRALDKKRGRRPAAQLRVTPAFGGLVLSGRF